MSNLVKGEGDLNAKIYIIGEAPGANEDKHGKPFIGGAGMVLNGLLQEAGIIRDSCYVDNIVQYQPPKNNFGVHYKDPQRIHPTDGLLENYTRIKALIEKNKPNVVIALGNEALYALTGNKKITKWRGSILESRGVKVIPTIHPAMVMRQYELRTQALFDLSKAKKESECPDFPAFPKENYTISPSFETIMSTLELIKKQEFISFDIETAMDINQILCIAFAWSDVDSICIPFFHDKHSFWTPSEELAIIKSIGELFKLPKKFIAQNAQFDMTYIKKLWGIDMAENLWMDTMIAHHCIYPELPKSLAFLVSIYTNYPYHKDLIHGGTKDFWHYNCLDSTRTWECAMEIMKEAKEFGVWDFYQEYSHKLIKPLFDMQNNGVKIDIEAREKIDKNLERDKVELQQRLEKAIGHPVNVGSPKQMKELLYDEFKYPIMYTKRKDKKSGESKKTPAADDDALEELHRRYPDNPMFKLIQDIRAVSKLLSTYVRAKLDEDNKIRCSYNIAGTDTGRLSSRKSVYGTGTNLQNIPRGPLIRSLFMADPGHFLVNADLSQAEARVVAYLSEDEILQKVFSQGGDIHRRNAGFIFKKHINQVTEQERELGKMLVHASNYGIGYRTFAKDAGCTEQRAKELLNAYHAQYPSIKRWHDSIKIQLGKTRILSTPLGRKRMFFGRWGDQLLRSAIAYVPQSTVGDLLNKGLVRAYNNLPNGWSMVLQVHDSVMFQVPEDTAPMHIYKFIHHYFEIPLEINRKRFVIPVDIKIGNSWGRMKKLEV